MFFFLDRKAGLAEKNNYIFYVQYILSVTLTVFKINKPKRAKGTEFFRCAKIWHKLKMLLDIIFERFIVLCCTTV
jgi:hypothetical protein